MAAEMDAEMDVIRLVQRADWKRLSLAAEVSDGSRLLLAPGRRYREEGPDSVRGCDGQRSWKVPASDEDRKAYMVQGSRPPLSMLLCPGWLLRNSRLEVRGRVTACGRDALHVVATERFGRPDPIPRLNKLRPGRTEALVDAELGILLRVAWLPPEDEPPEVTELVSLEVDPPIDPVRFDPPPGSVIMESWTEAFAGGGPVAAAAKTATGLAAGGVGVLVRYWPSGQARAQADPGDAEAAMPRTDPAPEMSPDGTLAGPEVSDEVLRLLHDSGDGAFDAMVHEWQDIRAMVSQVPESVRRTGFGGLGLLADALAERGVGQLAASAHTVTGLRVGGPGRFQVDFRYQAKRRAKTIACDGQHRWLVLDDKITVGPARPLPPDLADLANASWLLECRIAGGELIMAGDRPAYRLDVARGDAQWPFWMLFPAAVAVVDAELGIVLTLTSYLGGQPVHRHELREVATTRPADFRVDIPADLPTEPEASPPDPVADADSSHPGGVPLKLAGAVAREVGKEAAKAAHKFLRSLGSP